MVNTARFDLSCKYWDRLKINGLATFFLFLIASCQLKPADALTDQPIITKQDTAKVDESVPPEAFILSLRDAATAIVSVKLTQVDEVNSNIKVFSGTILKNYKGDLSKGIAISYAGMSDKKYPVNPTDTFVVFLIRHNKALSNLNHKNIYYSTIEENAMIAPYTKLDNLLKSSYERK